MVKVKSSLNVFPFQFLLDLKINRTIILTVMDVRARSYGAGNTFTLSLDVARH